MARVTETERRIMKCLIQKGRKDLANLYYLPREKFTWGNVKELVMTAEREYFQLEEIHLQEMENALLAIEKKHFLQDDKFIDKSLYDYTLLTIEKINKKIIDLEFIPIMQQNGLFDMLFNIPNLSKNCNVFDDKKQIKTKTGNIQLIAGSNMPLDKLIKNLSNSQIQLLCYCIHLRQKQRKDELTFNIKAYCELRGIVRQTKSVQKILRDFQVLEYMYFTFNTRVKGRIRTVENSQVLKITETDTRRNQIRFVFGEWINTLSSKQYSLFSKKFFQYGTSNNNNSLLIILSLKLNQILRNNLNKGKDENCLNVGTLMETLSFNQATIKAKGFSAACQEPIEQALDEMGWTEGYLWSYRNGEHTTFTDYKEDFIVFENPKMLESYIKNKAEKELITK